MQCQSIIVTYMFNTYVIHIFNVNIMLSLIYIGLIYFLLPLKNLVKEAFSGTQSHRIFQNSYLPQELSVILSRAIYVGLDTL